jgi:hypothetical protein
VTETIERKKCDHTTPEPVLNVFRAYKPIGLDPSSNPWSTVGADIELSKHRGDDGLTASWAKLLGSLPPFWHGPGRLGRQVFVNPDYAKIGPWAEKAADEAKSGVESLFLVPCSPETKWSRLARTFCSAWGPWKSRIAFEGAGGLGAKQPSAVYHFGPHRYAFAEHFEDATGSLVWCEIMPRRWGQE